MAKMPELKLTKVMVSEAGASVYSASELAAKEFPDLDVSLARRGVDRAPPAGSAGRAGQDRAQGHRRRPVPARRRPDAGSPARSMRWWRIASTRSASTSTRRRRRCWRASRASTQTLAANIVAFRDENGAFKTRTELKKVPRLGPKAFEQAAGFLRIMNGKNPLDASAVHPEAYAVVEKIAESDQTARSNRSSATARS